MMYQDGFVYIFWLVAKKSDLNRSVLTGLFDIQVVFFHYAFFTLESSSLCLCEHQHGNVQNKAYETFEGENESKQRNSSDTEKSPRLTKGHVWEQFEVLSTSTCQECADSIGRECGI